MVDCEFTCTEDMDRIMEVGPWAVKGATLNLLPWDPDLTLFELDFTKCAFWIQIHNLPPNYMNAINATRIGNFIGQFIKSDHRYMHTSVRKFLRIQMLVDSAQSLKTGCDITRADRSQIWVLFKYE